MKGKGKPHNLKGPKLKPQASNPMAQRTMAKPGKGKPKMKGGR